MRTEGNPKKPRITKIRKIVLDINTKIKANVFTDYGITDQFEVTRGLRQGYLLAPILFCLMIEPLIKWIRSESKGYTFHSNNDLYIPILAYMDDIVIIAKDKEELNKIINKLNEYFTYYEMIVLEKSVYTNNKKKDTQETIYI
jgi:Reverse transcriptase (RNA-dependent DNA polymerase)